MDAEQSPVETESATDGAVTHPGVVACFVLPLARADQSYKTCSVRQSFSLSYPKALTRGRRSRSRTEFTPIP